MISKHKKYFSFFGILAATVDRKMQSFYCSIDSIISNNLPKIIKLLLSKVLKPIKLYSTNNI
ncbi:hypothetical protein [Arcobacter cloacae]|uniref:Uncharacterized protein n=1 Tax=Arcobacter cloacae TaxID=1054034 RepID=A0A4Q0ZB41_9BACT|nr:hypothetical protein [Arcobacter cloacae]NCB13689.1 hypothetical protein [Erysipelotrichia bacterium]QKF89817.1 hypothetical protein ACLO_1318 [Arcobacter cloacae]RXI37433.1 hypothetical protein CP963_12675 [Arcobacter cloacae]RXJ83012.1 hypothetical protein CRU90_11635 [Arcobacter cloacae]